MIGRRRIYPRVQAAFVWTLGHARLWPFVLFAIVFTLSWHTLRQVHTREVRAALHTLDLRWLLFACAMTGANVLVMGLYDIIAFRHTRARPSERWRYGAVAFGWSNFLTLGPLAGPAIRLWLYRGAVDQLSDLHAGLLSVTIAFASGLLGWVGVLAVAPGVGLPTVAVCALVLAVVSARAGLAIAGRIERFAHVGSTPVRAIDLALVGWLDWLLAATVFLACVRATGVPVALVAAARPFFLGQVVGLTSLVPGGFGTSDALWIAGLPLPQSVSAAAVMAFRTVYYIAPWAVASLVLLAWATRRSSQRVEVARRIVAGLVGGAGTLIMLSSASPALYARLLVLERVMPLPLVEAGHVTAALAGLLLLVLARGLARGYRAALRATVVLLLLAAGASILKGLDWEESLILGSVAIAASSQAAVFDRHSRGDWLEGADLAVAFGALAMFVAFGSVSHHISTETLERWSAFGYRVQGARFVRTAGSMAVALTAASLYVLIRPHVAFEPPDERSVQQALDYHARVGTGTNPLMVATRDKSIFFAGDHGFCLYRTIGPYLAVFADPVVRSPADRPALFDALFAHAEDLDRRLLFYQISLDWVPLLHDRGYHFFKLGEEAQVPLDRVTLEGHAGKMPRQILRRAERDGLTFRILAPYEIEKVIDELRRISDDWLEAKGVAERQFSIGSFDESYLLRFRCAIVEQRSPTPRIQAFANLLEGPRREELSIDLMRSRSEGPHVMDFLMTSLFLEGKRLGYARFNLGMAPLASVGVQRGAHVREQLARVIFQRGEHWYNFRGVRSYKQ
ncbi:MAG TPA: phosphatidylglycerol lysyltransferase domain-containing protein, partial [Vicinamibacterales bacterium]